MSKLCISAVILLLVAASIRANDECGKVKVEKKTGKGDHAFRGQFPWLASLYNSKKAYICGATIISKSHLLTAANCVDDDTKGYSVLLGLYDLSHEDVNSCIRRNISSISIHKDYNTTTNHRSNGDIAVLKMAEPVQFTNYVQPICLPAPATNVLNIFGTVGGYGKTQTDSNFENLPSFVSLKTIGSKECLKKGDIYTTVVSDRSFCAGNGEGSPCKGDMGGGFYFHNNETDKYTIYGIVSIATDHCLAKGYVVLVDVPKYMKWVDEKMH